jgi:hypothetical protein
MTVELDEQAWVEANGSDRIAATFGLLGFESPGAV